MEWIPVESHQIQAIGYDSEASTLGVRFHPGKKAREAGAQFSEYTYANITPEMFTAFQAAESKSRWFEANVKAFPDAYPYQKVG